MGWGGGWKHLGSNRPFHDLSTGSVVSWRAGWALWERLPDSCETPLTQPVVSCLFMLLCQLDLAELPTEEGEAGQGRLLGREQQLWAFHGQGVVPLPLLSPKESLELQGGGGLGGPWSQQPRGEDWDRGLSLTHCPAPRQVPVGAGAGAV